MQVDDENFEQILEICYLWDVLSAGSDCELAAIHATNRHLESSVLGPRSLLTNRNLTPGVFKLCAKCQATWTLMSKQRMKLTYKLTLFS